MADMLSGIALMALGLFFVAKGKWGFALPPLAGGVFFIWRSIRNRGRRAVHHREFTSVGGHAVELSERMDRGETLDQIAEALDRQYRIAPVQTMQFVGIQLLGAIGRGQDAALTGDTLNWIAGSRPELLPHPLEVIGALDARRNVYGNAADMRHCPAPGEPGKPVQGSLLATRTHLIFLAMPNQDSFGEAAARSTMKDHIMSFLPRELGVVTLARDMFRGVRAELYEGYPPAVITDHRERFALADSFAIPWREVESVGKEPVPGTGPPRTHLVIAHGEESAPTVCRLQRGTGQDEAWVDDWIDGVRLACLLDGKLLLLS